MTIGMGLAGSALAQTVTDQPLAWKYNRDAPDELPRLLKDAPVEFPADRRDVSELGYVIFEQYLDATGRVVSLEAHASHPSYEKAANVPRVWQAGKRAGVGVNTVTTYGFIFTPAHPPENSSEAAPRLLEASIVYRRMPASKIGGPSPSLVEHQPDQVVWVDVQVDVHGRIADVIGAPEPLAASIKIDAKNWRFAPARREGVAVAAPMRVPFVVVTPGPRPGHSAKSVQPKATLQIRPSYPLGLRASGVRGEVMVGFIVDIEGRVRDAYVVRSLNPSFDEPALTAVRQWRFSPGTVEGRFVNTRMQVPIVFTIEGLRDGGEGPFKTKGKKVDQSKIPEAFRYDVAAVPTGSVRPVYPYSKLQKGEEGKAAVSLVIGAKGRVTHTQVTSATAPEFGQALMAAVEQFTFKPAMKDGKPTQSALTFEQIFDRDSRWQIVSEEELAALRTEQKRPGKIVELKDLDAPLTPISRKPIALPLNTRQESGQATLEFLVDEEGYVRLPRVVEATEEVFGYAAIQSVAFWRFQPPERGGRSVIVRAQLLINFKRVSP